MLLNKLLTADHVPNATEENPFFVPTIEGFSTRDLYHVNVV